MKSKKIKQLNKWMWKWHFIAGVILMPFILLLTITGTVYLFKGIYEDYANKELINVVKQE